MQPRNDRDERKKVKKNKRNAKRVKQRFSFKLKEAYIILNRGVGLIGSQNGSFVTKQKSSLTD